MDSNNNNNNNNNDTSCRGYFDTHGNYVLDDIECSERYNYGVKYVEQFNSQDLPEDVNRIGRQHIISSIMEKLTITEQSSEELFEILDDHDLVKRTPETKFKSVRYFGFKVDSNCCGKKNNGDDWAYKNYPLLRTFLPRGIVFSDDGTKKMLELFSNCKFFGQGKGDEDDGQQTTDLLERDNEGNYVKFERVLFTNKANGSSAQVSLSSEKNEDIWIGGSKNVKIAAAARRDINRYRKKRTYTFAVAALDTFFDLLESLIENDKLKLFTDLIRETGWTLNFELEDPNDQHIVPLYTRKLVLINFSGAHVHNSSCHPYTTLLISKFFDIPSVVRDSTIYPASQYDEKSDEARHVWKEEGVVAILLDRCHNVVGFVKIKTNWYKILRAIREKYKQLSKRDIHNVLKKTVERLDTIQKDFSIDPQYTHIFKTLVKPFCFWLLGDKERIGSLRERYALLWEEFLVSNNLPTSADLMESDLSGIDVEEIDEITRNELPLLVILQKIPGSGGGYICKQMVEKLNQDGVPAVSFSQDDFQLPKVSKSQAGKNCFSAVVDALQSGAHKVVFLDRNNASCYQYSIYARLDVVRGICKTVFVAPKELEKLSALKSDIYTCKKTIEELYNEYKEVYTFLYVAMFSALYRKKSNLETLSNEVNNVNNNNKKKGNKKNVSYIHPTDNLTYEKLASLVLGFSGGLKIHNTCTFHQFLSEELIVDRPEDDLLNIMNEFIKGGFRTKTKLTESQLKAFRLSIEDLSEERLLELHTQNETTAAETITEFVKAKYDRYIPPYDSYLAVTFDRSSREALVDAVKETLNVDEFASDWTIDATHITLEHYSNFVEERWLRILDHTGGRITIKPEALYYDENKICTLKVSLHSDKIDDVSEFVSSGIPHITIALAPKLWAVTSLSVLKEPNNQCLFNCDNLPSVNGTIRLVLQGENLE